MNISIKSIETNLTSNITKVTLDVIESQGSFSKVKDTLIFDLQGRYTQINQELMDAIETFLTNSGYPIV